MARLGLVVVFVFVCVVAGCGKKAPLEPPPDVQTDPSEYTFPRE